MNETELFEKAKNGCSAALADLVEGNMGLVKSLAVRFRDRGTEVEDLIQIGTIGLIKGISTFDASKGARLATYAARCVENATLTRMGF